MLCLMTATGALAQEATQTQQWQQNKEQFKSDKIAYISTKMNFSVEEAQKFWPIYNKYDEILDNIGEKRRKNFEPKRNKCVSELSEEICQQMLNTAFEIDQEELETRKQFYSELSKLFSQKTIMRYYHAEHEFRKKVICDTKQNGGSFGKSFKNN